MLLFAASVSFILNSLTTVFAAPVSYDIPSQPLSSALRQLAEQADIQLFFDTAIVEGEIAPFLKGDLILDDAIKQLLADTDLSYELLDDSILVIKLESGPTNSVREAEGMRVNEIIVTSRKRQENLQEVPLSITVLTSSVIEDKLLTDMRDATNFVPGFEFLQTATREFERPVIRGQATILQATESGVATFIDGLSFHSAISTISLADLERIEVIKGPQSALFGRNTYSGALNIISKTPSDKFQTNLSAHLGQFDEYDFSMGISGPVIGDTLSAGLYLRHYKYGGEYRNQFNGRKVGSEESDSLSFVLSYTPNPSLSVVSRFNYGRDDDGSPAMYLTPDSIKNVGFEIGGDTVAELYQGTVPTFPVNFDSAFVDDPGFEQERYWASIRADWEISDYYTFTSITGYEESEQFINHDFDLLPTSIFLPLNLVIVPGNPLDPLVARATMGRTENVEEQQTWQQEVRFAYDKGARFRSMIGAYFYSDSYIDSRLSHSAEAMASQQFMEALAELESLLAPRTIGTVIPPADRRRIIWRDTTNWALFGKVDLDFSKELTLTLEARYQEEYLDFSVFEFSKGDITFDGEDTFRSFSPRVTLDYSPNEDHLFYAVIANGTKPGGVNDDGGFDPLVNTPTFDEEKIWSFEVGAKNTFFNQTLFLNTAIYFNRLSDLQFTESVAQSDSTADVVITNNGDANIWGAELQVSYYPENIEGLGLQLSFAYNDSNLGKQVIQSDQGILDDIFDDGLQNCSLGDADPRSNRCKSVATSVGGHRLPRSSKYQVVAGVSYEKPLSADYDWFAAADYSYSSAQYVSAVNLAKYGEASLLNISAGFKSDRMKVSVWGKNITDEDSVLSVMNFINVSSFENTLYGTLRNGRQFGVSMSLNF